MTRFIKLTLWQMYVNAPERPVPGQAIPYRGSEDGTIFVNPDTIVSLHQASRGQTTYPAGAKWGGPMPTPVREWFTEVSVAVRHEEGTLEYTVVETPEQILALIESPPLPARPIVEFEYRNHRGETAIRHIVLEGLTYNVNPGYDYSPGWFVDGWCLDRQARRSFALANITVDAVTGRQNPIFNLFKL